MHTQAYVGRIALCTRKKLLKSGKIRDFYGNNSPRYITYPIFDAHLHTCHSQRAQEQPKTKYEPGHLITVNYALKKRIIYLSQL